MKKNSLLKNVLISISTVVIILIYPVLIVGIILVVLILGIIESFREKKAHKEEVAYYGLDVSYNDNPDNFVTYFPKEEKENLIALVKLISNDKITNYDFVTTYIENKDSDYEAFNDFIDELALKCIVEIDWKEELEDVVGVINILCKNLGYNVSLTESDITTKDDEQIKNRRKDNVITAYHDLNVIADILRTQGYEMIGLWSDADTYIISIIPISKIEEMKKIK